MTTENESPDTTNEPVLVEVAMLDAAGVYQGTKRIPADQMTTADFPLPDGCDLPVDQYRLDREKGCFLPIHDPFEAKASDPVALNAQAWLMLAINSAGIPLPTVTLEWLDYYVNSIDFVGSKGTVAEFDMLRRYKEKRGL
ncbi:MAG TPA: hypothetical protein VGK09_08415 [Rhodocyclaceae bacterium]|jgi:hypothetical protein